MRKKGDMQIFLRDQPGGAPLTLRVPRRDSFSTLDWRVTWVQEVFITRFSISAGAH